MIYKINILKNAKEDLDWFRKNDRKSYCKCFDLVREIMESPRKGLGKPEKLGSGFLLTLIFYLI